MHTRTILARGTKPLAQQMGREENGANDDSIPNPQSQTLSLLSLPP